MKIQKLYLIDSKISWPVFKKLNDKLVKDSGPSPKNMDKMLWQMIKEKRILAWFANELKDDMGLSLTVPKHRELFIIGNPKKPFVICRDKKEIKKADKRS